MSNDLISRKETERLLRVYADEVGCNRGEYELANGILKAACFLQNEENIPTAYNVDKVVEQIENCNHCDANGYLEPDSVIGIIKNIEGQSERHNNGWIPCSERLPEEPEEIPAEDEFIEEMILDGKFKEYIVTIYGAKEATTLYYIGNDNWYEEISSECYRVIAWQPLPESYKE